MTSPRQGHHTSKRGGSKPRDSLFVFFSTHITVPECGCWLWTGGIDQDGYGRMNHAGGSERAHRFAMRHFNRVDLGELLVCHKCDTRSCVNPSHLFLGTHRDNAHDAIRKGRRIYGACLPGELSLTARMTEAMAIKYFSDPRPIKVLMAESGISRTSLWDLRNRKTWRHLKL